jgi:hypothetical protein
MSHQASREESSSGSGTAASAEDRRRTEPRTLCDRPIAIMPMDGEETRFAPAQLSDCSPHGLGMTMTSAVKAGQQVLVRMNLNKMVLLVYTVRYCIPMKVGQYRAGARFTGYAANSFQGETESIVAALTGEGS